MCDSMHHLLVPLDKPTCFIVNYALRLLYNEVQGKKAVYQRIPVRFYYICNIHIQIPVTSTIFIALSRSSNISIDVLFHYTQWMECTNKYEMTAKVDGFLTIYVLCLQIDRKKYLSIIYNRTNLSVRFQVQFQNTRSYMILLSLIWYSKRECTFKL